MVNFGLLAAEIVSLVWGTQLISTGFASWQRYCTASSSARQPNFAALNRGRQLCLAGRPSRWALAHILVLSFSLSILSRRRLDVYYTSTHDVALVRIYDAGLKRAARGWLKIRDAKTRLKFAICAPPHNFVRHLSTIGKNLLNSNISPTCP